VLEIRAGRARCALQAPRLVVDAIDEEGVQVRRELQASTEALGHEQRSTAELVLGVDLFSLPAKDFLALDGKPSQRRGEVCHRGCATAPRRGTRREKSHAQLAAQLLHPRMP